MPLVDRVSRLKLLLCSSILQILAFIPFIFLHATFVVALVPVQQSVEDPLRGVPLLARRVEIVPQPGVDHLPTRIQPRTALLLHLPRLRPRGLKRGGDRGVADPMLALQRAARQSRASITPDRRI